MMKNASAIDLKVLSEASKFEKEDEGLAPQSECRAARDATRRAVLAALYGSAFREVHAQGG